MIVAVGTDHGAIEYKDEIIKYLSNNGYEVVDCGTNTEESCDYPDYAKIVAEKILNGQADCGILMCGTGIGMSLAANKVKGIRAAVVPNVDYAKLAKEHNNANIICLSGRFMTLDECKQCVDAYLNENFAGIKADGSGQRHANRVNKIMEIENEYFK